MLSLPVRTAIVSSLAPVKSRVTSPGLKAVIASPLVPGSAGLSPMPRVDTWLERGVPSTGSIPAPLKFPSPAPTRVD